MPAAGQRTTRHPRNGPPPRKTLEKALQRQHSQSAAVAIYSPGNRE
jgi:hypothetical protein